MRIKASSTLTALPMIDTRYCQLMADDNQWMNTKLYRACALLPEQA